MKKMIPKTYFNTVLNIWSTTKKPTWCKLSGYSMSPLMRHGDALLIQHGNRNIRIGDVIIFKSQQHQCAHRVVGITSCKSQKLFLAKGDNTYHFDSSLLPDQILAKVLQVKGTYGTLNLDSAFWRFLNFFIAIYSYAEAKRYKNTGFFWRIIDQLFSLRHKLSFLNHFHRHNLYKFFLNMNVKKVPMASRIRRIS